MSRATEGSVRDDLRKVLANQPLRGTAVWHHDDGELEFLREWIAGAPPLATPAAAGMPEVSFCVIRDELTDCARCGQVVKKRGPFGTGANGVMIILNMPSRITEFEKRFYEKDASELLAKMMRAIDVDLSECYVTELVKCEPLASSASPGVLFDNCRALLLKEIAELAPAFGVVMGELAPLQKTIHRTADMVWYAIEHPVVLLKNPDLKKPAWNTLKLLRAKMAERATGR